jgi:hypothetical protein
MEWIEAMPSDSLKSATCLFSEQLRLMLYEPVFAADTLSSYCHEVMDTQGHHALAACATTLCRLHRHNGVVQTVYRAVCGAALIHPGRETRALFPGCTDRAADLLAIVDGLGADNPDIPRLAIDVTVRDRVGATFRWSGKGSLHPVLAPRALKNEFGRSLSRRWSAVLLLRQVGLLTFPFVLWVLT